MSNKDFKEGLISTTKANEDFMQKQAKATELLGKRIIQKIDEQGNIIDVILDELNIQEKKELYGLQNSYNIAGLGENEKEVLASYLLTLISKYEQNTDNQKNYYFAVKKHLNVINVNADFNLSLIRNIDSKTEMKAIFQTVCEFLFLKKGTLSFLQDFSEVLDFFELSKQIINEITDSIQKIYNVLGLRGIVEHYIPAEEEDSALPDHFGLIHPLEGEFIFDDSNRDIPTGTEQIFENLKVVFPKQLNIDGKAVFKNCQIVFDYDGSYTVVIRTPKSEAEFIDCEFTTLKKAKIAMICNSGICTLKNCNVDGVKYNYGVSNDNTISNESLSIDYNRSFIDVDGYDSTAKLIMKHCNIVNCEGTFISADGNAMGKNFSVDIYDCLISNHTGNFLMTRFADQGNKTGVCISNSVFSNIIPYNQTDNRDFSRNNFLSFINIDSTSFECSESQFINIDERVFAISGLFNSSDFQITKCVFTKCKLDGSNIDTIILGTIKDCEFINLSGLKFGSVTEFGNKEVIVSQCSFKNINGYITLEYGKIEHCSFYDSSVNVEIVGKAKGHDYYCSEANNLSFVNCSALETNDFIANTPCFIQAGSYLDKEGLCVSFNGCKFKNCKTKGNYINTTRKVYGAFGRTKTIQIGSEWNTLVK